MKKKETSPNGVEVKFRVDSKVIELGLGTETLQLKKAKKQAMKNQIKLQQNIKSFIRSNLEGGYVAECLEISVVTQGNTLDEVVENLIEAVGLHLEDENPEDFGLVANPSIFVTFELQPEYVKA